MSAHLIEEWPVYRQLTGADRPGRETAVVAAARTLTGDPAGSCPSLVRVLLTGWFSFRQGEVTAGMSWPWSRPPVPLEGLGGIARED